MRLLLARQAFEKEVQLSEKGDWRRQGLKQMLQRCYNRGESKFSSLLIPVGTESIKLCERGLALGVASSTVVHLSTAKSELKWSKKLQKEQTSPHMGTVTRKRAMKITELAWRSRG